jgi:hypothetical protein
MVAFPLALGAVIAFFSLRIYLALARRNELRRRTLVVHRAYFDDRDGLARFYRIMGR